MKRCDRLIDVGRRQFLAGAAVAAAGAAATALPARSAGAGPSPALVDYPSIKLANLTDLQVDQPFDVAYPDGDSPGVLLKLGRAVDGGVGPDADIVAFSTLCPHKGFPLHYVADDKSLDCPGHYSRFDCEKQGMQIWGQATQNLPQFRLRVDDAGDIYAEGVDELIYGRLNNVLAG
ncbi:MAG: arsenate reductase (azurin) small subunit [Rhodospirillales bacterium]